MILSAQSIRRRQGLSAGSQQLLIRPWSERAVVAGMSFGLSGAGYDVRIKDRVELRPGEFALATTVEWLSLPNDIMGKLADKSSWARRGLALQNTIFEPGWFGYPTIELSNHSLGPVVIEAGWPIGQFVFQLLDEPTDSPYGGKYQDQPQRPVECIEEDGDGY